MSVLTHEVLMGSLKQFNLSDPLEEKGIAKDWVCVINDRTYAEIKAWLAQNSPTVAIEIGDPVERFLRRDLWVIGRAESGLNFMPQLEMFTRYAAHFLHQIEMAKQRKQDEADAAKGGA